MFAKEPRRNSSNSVAPHTPHSELATTTELVDSISSGSLKVGGGGGGWETWAPHSLSGILPIAKSSFVDWELPGHGDPYFDCGHTLVRGCDNVGAHPAGVDGRPAGAVFVQLYRRCCARAECPICYEAWASKEASKAEHRIRSFKPAKFRRPIHVIASVPKSVFELEFGEIRRLAQKIVKKAGVFGGCCIFHPKRQDSTSKLWYFSPHFHVVGYGWVRGTELIFESTGWVVKNAGVRKSVRATLQYILSHAGVKRGRHTITWFGALSYNKLVVPKIIELPPRCPICMAELKPLPESLIGGLDPPPEFGDYWFKSGIGLVRWV